jgi:hypothetical protein
MLRRRNPDSTVPKKGLLQEEQGESFERTVSILIHDHCSLKTTKPGLRQRFPSNSERSISHLTPKCSELVNNAYWLGVYIMSANGGDGNSQPKDILKGHDYRCE